MPQLGNFALLLALALSGYAFAAGALSLWRPAAGPDRLRETARRAGIAVWITVSVAVTALLVAAFTNDFSVAYIAHHSNITLPAAYKFAALWSGQEGSLLFWAWLLGTYGLVLRLRHKTDRQLFAYAGMILAGIQFFFQLLLVFSAPPFAMMAGTPPADGNGLNPLLQYPEMVIHPPMLYLGYVGFSVPFAFALGALIMRYPGEKWIHITRRWTMVTWLFLTFGVFLGMHWAYAVLGWGGYWGWDPVENASVMPWLTGTAFLHSVMMQEKRGMLKVWNVWLIFATFMLSIFGTTLTRGGLVSSVHAFAQSSIGEWFLGAAGWSGEPWKSVPYYVPGFLTIVFAACLYFFLRNRDHLKSENKLESLVSRESSFLFNNLLLLAACFVILWGTLFPILSEWVQGTKVTVGPPFFNRVELPIAMLLLLLTAMGPLLAWRKTSIESMKRNFGLPAILAAVTMAVMIAAGEHPWEDAGNFYSLIAAGLGVLVVSTVVMEFVRGGRVIASHSGTNLFAGMLQLTRRNTRRYGGYVVHIGVALVVVGMAGLAFNQDKEQEMGYGDKLDIGRYTLVCRSYTQDQTPNYDYESAILDVYRGGDLVTTMYPEQRFYHATRQPQHMVAIRSTPREDLYLIYAGQNPDTGRPIIKARVNPLVMWVWVGLLVMAFGTLVALVPNAQAKLARLTKPVKVRAAIAEAAVAPTSAMEAGD
jgi:cytochrome c-type biogenesis protein CcmF